MRNTKSDREYVIMNEDELVRNSV